MITELDRAKYGAEYAALELREGQALLQEFRNDFSSTEDNRMGRGAAGNVYRFNVSIQAVHADGANIIERVHPQPSSFFPIVQVQSVTDVFYLSDSSRNI